MSEEKRLEELRIDLNEALDVQAYADADPNIKSWGLEVGVLITKNQALIVLDLINDSKKA